MTRRSVRASAAACVALLALAGCTDDPDPTPASAGVLTESDLPDVESSRSYTANGTADTGCAPLTGVEPTLRATDPPAVGRAFTLAGGTRVISSLLGIYVAESTVDYTIDRIDRAIDECTTAAQGEFERLEGLLGGAVGFRSTVDRSDGPITTERAYVVTGEDTVAVVTVEHIGAEDPPVTVSDLLPIAIERARGDE